MLKMRDLFRLQGTEIFTHVHALDPGLMILSGKDGSQSTENTKSTTSPFRLHNSGREMIFRTYIEEEIELYPDQEMALVVWDERIQHYQDRSGWRKIHKFSVDVPENYASEVFLAFQSKPDLLIIDQLDEQNAGVCFDIANYASSSGMRVLAQVDAPFLGEDVLRLLKVWGVSQDQLGALTYLLTFHRLPTLCPNCRTIYSPTEQDFLEYQKVIDRHRFSKSGLTDPSESRLVKLNDVSLYDATGCSKCGFSGRQGDAAVLEVTRQEFGKITTLLPVEESLLNLVQAGLLPISEVIYFRQNLSLRIFSQMAFFEKQLDSMNRNMLRVNSELNAVSRVLDHRNQALFSYQDIGNALIRADTIYDLGERVCRHAQEICGAERVILYVIKPDDLAEIAASIGWDEIKTGTLVSAAQITKLLKNRSMMDFRGLPPGLDFSGIGLEMATQKGKKAYASLPKGGILVSLHAQENCVGAMLVQSMSKKEFLPGETAILQSFANQAALALQRASLIEDLRSKITQLELAQSELAEKERMAHEMELAREVQRSVLPQSFVDIPGYEFGASYQAARQVGGDFYDIFRINDEHFGVVVADVSDKGMPAALYMALTRSLLLAQARQTLSPGEVVCQVNQLLLELSTADMFVTVFYGVIHQASHVLTYVRAGHDRPALIRGDRVIDLDGSGMALGVVDSSHMDLEEKRLQLNVGDRLVLFSDGLTDASDPSGKFFGRNSLLKLLSSTSNIQTREVCQVIFWNLLTFQDTADQYDDMTILVIDVKS